MEGIILSQTPLMMLFLYVALLSKTGFIGFTNQNTLEFTTKRTKPVRRKTGFALASLASAMGAQGTGTAVMGPADSVAIAAAALAMGLLVVPTFKPAVLRSNHKTLSWI